MIKPLVTIGAIVALLALGWIGGEMHMSNCLAQGNKSCSRLPWDNGKGTFDKGQRITIQGPVQVCPSEWGDLQAPDFC